MTALHYPQPSACPPPAPPDLSPLSSSLAWFQRLAPPVSPGEQHTRVRTHTHTHRDTAGTERGPRLEAWGMMSCVSIAETRTSHFPVAVTPPQSPPFSPGALWAGARARGGRAALARTARHDPFHAAPLIPGDSRAGSGKLRDAAVGCSRMFASLPCQSRAVAASVLRTAESPGGAEVPHVLSPPCFRHSNPQVLGEQSQALQTGCIWIRCLRWPQEPGGA